MTARQVGYRKYNYVHFELFLLNHDLEYHDLYHVEYFLLQDLVQIHPLSYNWFHKRDNL